MECGRPLYLVGQEAVGDVAMRIDGRRHDRAVGDANTVVHFIPFLHCEMATNG
jgi:hypothetical protein